ncbi:MAG: VWA domain-containing protein [Pseudomonadota bacterium]
MLDFADPLFLLLLPLPVLAWLWLAPLRAGGAALQVPEGIGARLGQAPGRATGSRTARLLPLLLWLALVSALAGPRLLVANPALPVSGRDLVLALDLSGSMIRDDFEIDGNRVSRIAALKHVATGFARGRGGDRMALVVFGSRAYYATPPTYDVEAIAHAVEKAEIGISGRATSISDGLGLALKRLDQSDAAAKVVILLSDGAHNSGPAKPRDTAKLARDLGVRVHTIAMGPESLKEADDPRGAVDVETLNAIAELSGGEAFRVRTTEDLVRVAAAIDRLEAISTDGPGALVHRPLWTWPAGAAVLLCFGIMLGFLRT